MDSAIVNALTMVNESSSFHIFTGSELSNSGSLLARDPKGIKMYFFVGLTAVIKVFLCVGIPCLYPQFERDGQDFWHLFT